MSSALVPDGALGMRYRDGWSCQPQVWKETKRVVGEAGGDRYNRDGAIAMVRVSGVGDAGAAEGDPTCGPSHPPRGASAGDLAGGCQILCIRDGRPTARTACLRGIARGITHTGRDQLMGIKDPRKFIHAER